MEDKGNHLLEKKQEAGRSRKELEDLKRQWREVMHRRGRTRSAV